MKFRGLQLDVRALAGGQAERFDAALLWLAKVSFGGSARRRFYRKIRTYLKNEWGLKDALEQLERLASRNGTQPYRPLAVAMRVFLGRVKEGTEKTQLAAAMEGFAPENELMLIEAGERGTGVIGTLDRAVWLVTMQHEIVASIISALAYPVFLSIAFVGVLWDFGEHVLPSFETSVPLSQWTGAAADMASVVGFVRHGLWLSVGAAMAFVALIVATLPTFCGLAPYFGSVLGRLRTALDRYPPWSFYRLVVGGQFLCALAALLEANVSLQHALERLAEGASPYLSERVLAMYAFVKEGHNPGEALLLAGFRFPDEELVRDLVVYGAMPEFSNLLPELAAEWVKGSVEMLNAEGKIVFYGGILAIGGLVAWLMSGMFALQDLLGAAASRPI